MDQDENQYHPQLQQQIQMTSEQLKQQMVQNSFRHVIIALERLEKLTENTSENQHTELGKAFDRHEDGINVNPDKNLAVAECANTIALFHFVLKPIRELEADRLTLDLCRWVAGRKNYDFSIVDQYTDCVLDCLTDDPKFLYKVLAYFRLYPQPKVKKKTNY